MWQAVEIDTGAREEMLDVTARVAQLVQASGVTDGTCYLFVPHTTAGVTINENADPEVRRDIVAALAGLVPRHASYHHREGNADAHVKASLVGHSQVIPVRQGRLVLGTWQGIFFCEFDGPRRRRIMVGVR